SGIGGAHARAQVGELEIADLVSLTGRHRYFALQAPRRADEADEHTDDAEMHDVAAVATTVLGHQVEEGRQHAFRLAALLGRTAPRAHAALKFLHDHRSVEGRQRNRYERR